MDGLDVLTVMQGRCALPGAAKVTRALEVDGPGFFVFFGGGFDLFACGAEDAAIGELHRFVFYGSEDAFWQALRLAPGLALVCGCGEHPPPCLRCGAGFVEEQEWAFLGLEKDRIPRGVADDGAICEGVLDAVGHFDALGPFAFDMAGDPDADVGVLFVCAAEPGGDKACGCLDEGGGVDLRVGAGVVNELGGDYGSVCGEQGWGCKCAEEERFHGG